MSVKISVIIPIYNMERHLERCIDSVISQSYTNLEIVLVDDGSTDASGKICDEYAMKDARIQILHKINGGVSSARNAGLELASGDYISFVDPDDWIASDMYGSLVKGLSEKAYDIIRFNAWRKQQILNELPFRGEYDGLTFEQKIVLPWIGAERFGGMFILGVLWLHLFKRDIIERYHIRFDHRLRRCEDRLFTLTVVLHSQNILFIENAMYHYEVYDDSLSNKYDPERWEQEQIYLEALREVYVDCQSDEFIEQADCRLKNEYILRGITSINNEFFSDNNNTFTQRYRAVKHILNTRKLKEAFYGLKKESSGLKGLLILKLMEYRFSFLLTVFNTLILYKNKF